MSNSKLASILAALVAVLGFLAGWHWTGEAAGTIGTVVGIASAFVSGVNEELHDSASGQLTFLGVVSVLVAAFVHFESTLPAWAPLILGSLGAVLTAIGAPIANVPALSASQEPR